MLRERFEPTATELYDTQEEVDYGSLVEFMGLPFADLRDPSWTPLVSPAFQDEGIFAAIQAGDVLVHRPYESFDASIEAFIHTAADDPQTSSIKMPSTMRPRYTENIRIRSIIGGFLEHSRIAYFANGKEDHLEGDFFIGSADWMVTQTLQAN